MAFLEEIGSPSPGCLFSYDEHARNILPRSQAVYTGMRRLFLPFLFAGALLMPNVHAECIDHPITLQQMHDCYRVLLVFAPNPNDAHLQSQLQQLDADPSGFRERNLILVPVLEPGSMAQLPQSQLPTATLTPEDEAMARQKFHRHDNFQVVLLGKDGGEKSRADSPMAPDKLYSTIDSMPMRKAEMKHQ